MSIFPPFARPLRSVPASICAALLVMAPTAQAQVAPHASYGRMVTSNGHGVVSYNADTKRVDTFLEHAYRFSTPRNPDDPSLCFAADETRNLAYDSYFGLKVSRGAATPVGRWLPDLDLDAVQTLPGTGIIHATQTSTAGDGGLLRAETFAFMPIDGETPALVQVLRVTNLDSEPLTVSPYALFNYRLGAAFGGRVPSADAEQAAYDATRATFYEYSDQSQGTIAFTALTDVAHTTVSGSTLGIFPTLQRGEDLDDSVATAGPRTDVVPGLQGLARTLAPAEAFTWAVATSFALNEDAAPLVDALITHVGTPANAQTLLDDEQLRWDAWHVTGDIPPAELSPAQQTFYRHNAAMLRMGQVDEPGAPKGQLLASLPPGLGNVDAQWNIAWVRDMAYATAGLSATGHLDEAWDALRFQLESGPGKHTAAVGMPYRLSITRYFGDGKEESDCNADGPNIEFDGFGLFLWTLADWIRAGGDLETIRPYWPRIRAEIVDVIVALQEPDGLLRADSSIWEVHQNGRQRRFAYTSMAAARGLCDAATLATALGETADAARYTAAGERTRDAIATLLVDGNGALGQSREDIVAGENYADAAAVEAINWGLIDPNGRIANATLDFLTQTLSVPSGHGLMRNDDGGDYDSQEWVFVDLRMVAALKAAGRTAEASALLTWVEQQSIANDRQVAELYDRDNADYLGSIPMVGFGAGAWALAALDLPPLPACGAYAPETPTDVDAGPDDAGVPLVDAGDVDAGDVDAGNVDAGDVDAGNVDAGNVDAGDVDAGDVDTGDVDAGDVDAGDVDAGNVDAGNVDAGDVDAGEGDAGSVTLEPAPTPEGEPDAPQTGCDCDASGPLSGDAPLFAFLFAALFLARRRQKTARQSH